VAIVAFALATTACARIASPEGWASPVLGDGLLLAAHDDKLFALEAETLEPRWAFPSPEQRKDIKPIALYGTPAIGENTVFVPTYDGTLYALNAESGEVRWFAETDISLHEDDELLSLMRDSGCAQVLIGLESPTPGSLQGIELRNNWKGRWWPQYKEAIRRIQSHGIRVNGCFVIGLDGHGPEVFDDVYNFVLESELFDVQITVQTPFPGTPLYERLKREGRLLYDGHWNRCTLFDINYEPRGMTVAELRVGFRQLGQRLYAQELTKWRRENFNRKYLRPTFQREEESE